MSLLDITGNSTVTIIKIITKESAKRLAKLARKKHGSPAESLEDIPMKKKKSPDVKASNQESGPKTRSKLQ